MKEKSLSAPHDAEERFKNTGTILGIKLQSIDEEKEKNTREVWQKAFESVFKEDKLFSNAAGDLVKAVLRFGGWMALELFLYGGRNLFRF